MSEQGAVVRRRGRPQRLPEDPHTLVSGKVGTDQRIAWLLTVSRTLGPDPSLARRDGFIAALKERGIAVDGSRVSRWESGLQPVPNRVAAAYESVLGVTEGSLVAVVAGLRRGFGAGPTQRENPMTEAPLDSKVVESLLDRTEQQAATGAHWLQLADQLNRYEAVFLREREWVLVTRQLVHELSRSVGFGYVRRYEAAASFVRHPNARRYLMMAIGSFVTNPDAEVVAPVLNLLSEVRDPAASQLVLRMLAAENSRFLRTAAASVAAVKLARGHFDDEALPRLESHVLGALRRGESLDARLDYFDLAVQLPEESWQRVAGGLRTRRSFGLVTQARESGELVSSARAAALVADLAPTIQAETPAHQQQEPDLMLRRLLREALLHAHKPRRHHAALLLAASPYAAATARECLKIAQETNDLMAARAWTIVMRVGDGGRCADVMTRGVTDDRPTVRSRALINVGLCPTPLDEDVRRSLVDHVDHGRIAERHAALFALGMNGCPEIDDLTKSDDDEIARAARWWSELGPAIHDRDLAAH